jgi:hypothetical protein
VLLYDEAGRPRTLDSGSDAGVALVETARALVEVAGPDEHTSIDVPEEE